MVTLPCEVDDPRSTSSQLPVPDPADARRIHYRLTEKGIDLAPALIEIVLWSARYEDTDAPPPSSIRAMRSNRKQFLADVRKRWSEAA